MSVSCDLCICCWREKHENEKYMALFSWRRKGAGEEGSVMRWGGNAVAHWQGLCISICGWSVGCAGEQPEFLHSSTDAAGNHGYVYVI